MRLVASRLLRKFLSSGRVDVEVEEIVWATYEAIYARACNKRFPSDLESLRGYSVGIVRKKAIDAQRKIIALEHISIEEINFLPDTRPNPLEEILRREQLRTLKERISTLRTDEQEIIHLWMKGHSYHEIASMLEITEATLKSKLFRLRQKLSETDPGVPEHFEVFKAQISTPEDQQIVRLRMKGYTYLEIANTLEMSVSTVKERLIRFTEKCSRELPHQREQGGSGVRVLSREQDRQFILLRMKGHTAQAIANTLEITVRDVRERLSHWEEALSRDNQNKEGK